VLRSRCAIRAPLGANVRACRCRHPLSSFVCRSLRAPFDLESDGEIVMWIDGDPERSRKETSRAILCCDAGGAPLWTAATPMAHHDFTYADSRSRVIADREPRTSSPVCMASVTTKTKRSNGRRPDIHHSTNRPLREESRAHVAPDWRRAPHQARRWDSAPRGVSNHPHDLSEKLDGVHRAIRRRSTALTLSGAA
jgi:hypothetical protein